MQVNPDLKFIHDVKAAGGENLKKCFQCATCSAVCNLSPQETPFPRKEMIWAQWGLKEKLMGDPDVWLCHACNDCSIHCPRDARPGEVLAAVRNRLIRDFSAPLFLGRMLNHPKYLGVLLIIPALLLGLAIAATHQLKGSGKIIYGDFFPHLPLQIFFTTVTGLAALGALAGVARFWKALNRYSEPPKTSIVAASIVFFKDLLTHGWFRDCATDKGRSTAHLLIFFGFLFLLVATAGAVYCAYITHTYPLGLWHPIKIIGNIGAILLTLGCFMVFRYRLFKPDQVGHSTFADWVFLTMLTLVSVTGIVTEVVRYANVASLAYPIYFVHLVLVFYLLVYAPYSKFAHFFYRTVAMVHAGMRGRNRGSRTKV